ncbi:uncharacterized protein METZ01_LOCUS115022 [marine metagenome]|uniref:Uncharacterized protein n=1 Tax=marine metagenome TaxID=408172 RepID=A0A381XBS6_9ZZZZ
MKLVILNTILAENSDYADRDPYCSSRFLWFVKA